MTRVRKWKWRVSVVGISALLFITGLFCLPDQVRAGAVSNIGGLARNLEIGFTSALSNAFVLAQTEFHAPGSAPPANAKIAARLSRIAENFDSAQRLPQNSFLAENHSGSPQLSLPDFATSKLGDKGAGGTSTHDSLSGDPHSASNVQNPKEHGRGGAGVSSGSGGASGSGSVGQSGTGSASSRTGANSGHLRIDSNPVHSSVSSIRTARATATIALAGSLHGPKNTETASTPTDNRPAEAGGSGEGETHGKRGRTKYNRRETFQSSPGSTMTAGSAVLPSQDSANMLNAGNNEANLLRDLGSEDRNDPASIAANSADEADAAITGIPGDALSDTIPDLPAHTDSGAASAVITQDLFASDGGNGLTAGDQPPNLFNALENNFQVQDQAFVDASVSASEPASLLLLGAALLGAIAFAKIKGLWQSPM